LPQACCKCAARPFFGELSFEINYTIVILKLKTVKYVVYTHTHTHARTHTHTHKQS
jgi:hypothetical protein